MKSFIAHTMLAVCVVGVLAACEELPESAIRGYRVTYPPNQAADALQGSWSAGGASSCVASGSYYVKDTLLFFGRQLSQVRRQFADSLCQTTMYTLTIGKTFELPDDETAATQNLDTTLLVAQMGVSTGYAADANTESLCGLTSWTDTTSVNVAGLSCFSAPSTLAVPALNSTSTDVVVLISADSITFNTVSYERDTD